MKKFLFIVCCVLLTTAIFAVEVPRSIENEVTFGTFKNVIDASFNANSKFGLYDQHFIYGGLGNPNQIGATKGNSGSLDFGYYMPWKMPMSFYASVQDFKWFRTKGKTTKTEWDSMDKDRLVKKTIETKYNLMPLTKNFSGGLNYLIGLGGKLNMVTGIEIGVAVDNSSLSVDNFAKTTTTTPIYDTDKKEVGKTVETDSKKSFGGGDSIKRLEFGIPFALTTGNIDHNIKLDVNVGITGGKSSREYKMENSGKTIAGIPNKNYSEKTTKKQSKEVGANIMLGYRMSMPAKREGDSWSAGASLGFIVNPGRKTSEETEEIIKGYDHTGKLTVDTLKEDSTESKGSKTSTFSLGLFGGRSFNFASPDKVYSFKISPKFALGFNVKKDNGDSSSVTTHKEKLIGSVASTGSTTETTTTQGTTQKSIIFKTTLEVPMGLKIMPEGWKFGFLLGAKIDGTTTVKSTKKVAKDPAYTVTKVTPIPGTASTTEKYGATSITYGTDSYTAETRFYESHNLGITVPFSNGAHFDVLLSGSLLEFNNFKIQAFIPLGTGK